MNAAAITLAAGLVGLPYEPGATGPRSFYCWGLVRYWFLQLHGLDMAPIEVAAQDGAGQASAIREAARVGGWRPISEADPTAQPVDGDVLLMNSLASGLLHVGTVVDLRRGDRRLLHCEGSADNPAPGVQCEPLDDALMRFLGVRIWRRRA